MYFTLFLFFSSLLSCSDDDAPKDPIANEYELDEEVFPVNTEMYWEYSDDHGGIDQIRLKEPLAGSSLFDLIAISPVPGSESIEGIYVYSKTEDIGTYDLVFLHATDLDEELAWYTNGDAGGSLEITYMGKVEGKEVFRVIVSEFTLNYGYWDYLAGKWVSLGLKTFSLSYEGTINS